MRVVFMGTPDFAVPSLEALARTHDVVLVLTRPDAVRGRGRTLVPSPVKAAALELGLPVHACNRIDDEAFAALEAAGADIMCVAAFGAILPQRVLDLAPLGCVNVHASLLPRWRGAAPIQRAILAGDERLGVSIMRVVRALDAGAYCRQASVEAAGKGCAQLTAELAELGARELVTALPDIEAGTVGWTAQDEALVTYADKVTKAEMVLDPGEGVDANLRRVAAATDEAPARARVAGQGVRVLEACRFEPGWDVLPGPGEVIVRRKGAERGVYLGCDQGEGDGGCLRLLRVRPDGKREMDGPAWAAGLQGSDLSWGRA